MVKIMRCSTVQNMPRTKAGLLMGGWMSRPRAWMMLNIMRTPANWPRKRGMSASIDEGFEVDDAEKELAIEDAKVRAGDERRDFR